MNNRINIYVQDKNISCVNCNKEGIVFNVRIGDKLQVNLCNKCLLDLYREAHEILLYDWSVMKIDTN